MSYTFSDPYIRYKYVIDLVFTPEEPIHIGDIQEGITKKLLLFNVYGHETPIIPSESIKGVLRHLATKLAKTIYEKTDLEQIVKCHNKDIHTADECKKHLEKCFEEAFSSLKHRKIFPDDKLNRMYIEDRETILEIYLFEKCPICYLFGSKSRASNIIITDFLFSEIPPIYIYTATSINRKTKTVAEDKLYQLEYVPPSTEYKASGRLIINNVPPGTPPSKLLATLLKYICDTGLLIGGSKSRGYGLIKLSEESKAYVLKLNPSPMTEDEILQNVKALLLIEDNVATYDINEFINFLLSK